MLEEDARILFVNTYGIFYCCTFSSSIDESSTKKLGSQHSFNSRTWSWDNDSCSKRQVALLPRHLNVSEYASWFSFAHESSGMGSFNPRVSRTPCNESHPCNRILEIDCWSCSLHHILPSRKHASFDGDAPDFHMAPPFPRATVCRK